MSIKRLGFDRVTGRRIVVDEGASSVRTSGIASFSVGGGAWLGQELIAPEVKVTPAPVVRTQK